jgi:hypothetical protein
LPSGRFSQKTTDIIQGLPRVAELFEVRRPKKEAVIAEEPVSCMLPAIL